MGSMLRHMGRRSPKTLEGLHLVDVQSNRREDPLVWHCPNCPTLCFDKQRNGDVTCPGCGVRPCDGCMAKLGGKN